MSQIDIKRLAKLVGYGTLNESFEYEVDFGTPASTGKAAHHYQTNAMGDNPMRDPKDLEETDESNKVSDATLKKFKHMLNGVGVKDSDIAMDMVALDPDQAKQICKLVLNIDLEEEEAEKVVAKLCELVSDRLLKLPKREQLDEFQLDDEPMGSRFSHTLDNLGNIMVRDALTDRSVYLQGSSAVELVNLLQQAKGEPDEVQDILGQYENLMESSKAKPSVAYLQKVDNHTRRIKGLLESANNAVQTKNLKKIIEALEKEIQGIKSRSGK